MIPPVHVHEEARASAEAQREIERARRACAEDDGVVIEILREALEESEERRSGRGVGLGPE